MKFSYACTAEATLGSVGVELLEPAVVSADELGSAEDDDVVGIGSVGNDDLVVGLVGWIVFEVGRDALLLQPATSIVAHKAEAMIASAVLVSRTLHPIPPGVTPDLRAFATSCVSPSPLLLS
jgi:hypothetical protein